MPINVIFSNFRGARIGCTPLPPGSAPVYVWQYYWTMFISFYIKVVYKLEETIITWRKPQICYKSLTYFNIQYEDNTIRCLQWLKVGGYLCVLLM
jgi:hypothetical protein